MKNNSVTIKSVSKTSRHNKRWEDYAKSVRYRIRKIDLKSVNVTPASNGRKHLLVP
jgi:hypothetical protein